MTNIKTPLYLFDDIVNNNHFYQSLRNIILNLFIENTPYAINEKAKLPSTLISFSLLSKIDFLNPQWLRALIQVNQVLKTFFAQNKITIGQNVGQNHLKLCLSTNIQLPPSPY